jgi:hypothetical protein
VNVGGQEVCPFFAVYRMTETVHQHGGGPLVVSVTNMLIMYMMKIREHKNYQAGLFIQNAWTFYFCVLGAQPLA